MREVGKDNRQRNECHQRAYAAASLNHFELLCLARAQRHQLNNVSLSQDRDIKNRHRPNRAARRKELQRKGNLVEDYCGYGNGQQQQEQGDCQQA